MIYLRLAGQILSACLAGLCLVFMVGEGTAFKLTPWHLSLDIALIGLVLGVFKPLPGGMLALAGIGLFYALNYNESGRWPGGWVFPLFWVAGALLILSSAINRKKT